MMQLLAKTLGTTDNAVVFFIMIPDKGRIPPFSLFPIKFHLKKNNCANGKNHTLLMIWPLSTYPRLLRIFPTG